MDVPAAVVATDPITPRRRRPFYTSLFFQILVAVALGIIVGIAWPSFGADLKPLGDGFIRLIKMLIAPLIFCVVVTGIAKVGDMRSVGRIGLKAILWFEAATTVALVLGLLAANLTKPGAGLNIDPATLDTADIEAQTSGAELPHTVDFLLNIIPTSVVNAFATNSLLQVLLFACLFGVALASWTQHHSPALLNIIDDFTHVIFTIIGYIMRLAPIGAFGAIAFTVGRYGASSLSSFGKLILVCYGTAALFLALLAGVAWLACGLNLWHFVRYAREEMLLALGTASSESVLPRIIAKLTNAGCDRAVVGFVVPTGYSFNLDGASIYLSIAIVFLAQAVGVDLSLTEQLTIIAVLMLTSKGMAGVPGSAFLALSATAAAMDSIPVAAVALLLGADRFMDSMRVATNLLGNCVATFVVARWEGRLDVDRMRAVLSGRVPPSGNLDLVDEHTDGALPVPVSPAPENPLPVKA